MTDANTSIALERQEVRLQIITRAEDFEGRFDRVEVWRSESLAAGPYEEITSSTWQPARITGEVVPSGLANVVGKTLRLFLSGSSVQEVSFTFVGSDPLALAAVASQITTSGLGLVTASTTVDGRLQLETTQAGGRASLQVVPGDAAALLGLPLDLPAAFSQGKEVRLALSTTTPSRDYVDFLGARTFFYKTRFRSNLLGSVGEFSDPFSANDALYGLDVSHTVVGWLELVGSNGGTVIGREVSMSLTSVSGTVAGKLVDNSPMVRRTDENGRVEFTLLRGQRYVFAVSGMTLTREVLAPTDTDIDSFSLIDPAYSTQEDYYKVRVPDLPTLERRTL